ncbi:MAG TPA: alpha/beta hydrolase [Candidatus Fimivivens sp.]|nr:alpha/beta hydrolase [Candidatus Fimivivens sp.]
METEKKQIVFIHGGDVFADRHEVVDYLREVWQLRDPLWSLEPKPYWRDAIARRFFERADIFMPEMPNKLDARYTEWEAWFDRHVPLFRDDLILIGSSLGGIFLAKYLATRTLPVSVRLLALVAAPFDDESRESLGDFRLPRNLDGISRQAEQILLFHSKDDPVVPFTEVEKYARALSGAEAVMLDGRGHFMTEDFPELSDRIGRVIT